MHTFEVWAPAASRVDIVIGDRRLPTDAASGGWWRLTVDDAGPGTRYRFSLDGGPGRPDPRSASQPEGPEGPSEVVDQDAYPWADAGWRGVPLQGAILYELHVGAFTPSGTFTAVADHLPHLVSLGVDAIELLPVAEFPGRHGWGYDGVDLFAPHHAYGGPDGLKQLVGACHTHGLGVVLDVVYNHLGPSGNHLSEFGPYFSDRHHTNWGDAVNFDGPGSDEVRRFVVDNAVMWLRDYHIDGLRLDATHAIVDQSARHILEQLTTEVDALATHLGRHLFVTAESDLNDPRLVRSRDAGGFGLDAVWADEWHHALHAALTGERAGYYEDFGTLHVLGKALRQAWVHDGTWSAHRGRHHGAPPNGLPGHRFVVCTQNHDQVGNRAVGERSAALMSEGRLRVAAALLLTTPFTPLLFQGEEWAASSPFQYFTDHSDPELGRAVSDGRRREFARFGWDPGRVPDPQDPRAFERSKLRWEEIDRGPHQRLLAWYRELIALRRAHPALSDPRLERVHVDADEDRRCVVLTRGPVMVLVNLGETHQRFAIGRDARVLAMSDPGVERLDGDVSVPPDAVAIIDTAE